MEDEWEQSLAGKQTFWINLWQRSGGGEKMPIARIDELDAWVSGMAESAYPEDSVELDGYGWMVNPIGSRAQEWHVVHRAISNTGDFHRPVFWIAVKKKGEERLPEEPLVEIAH